MTQEELQQKKLILQTADGIICKINKIEQLIKAMENKDNMKFEVKPYYDAELMIVDCSYYINEIDLTIEEIKNVITIKLKEKLQEQRNLLGELKC